MADFFNNLLLRSSASGKSSGALVQPRLPSLFESTGGIDEISSPPADSMLHESFSSRLEGNSPHAPEQSTAQNTELPPRPSAVAAPPPESRLAQQSQPARRHENNPAASMPEENSAQAAAQTVREKPPGPVENRPPQPHPSSRGPDQTVRAARERGAQSLSSPGMQPPEAHLPHAVEPQLTVMASPAQRDVPALDLGAPAAREGEPGPQPGGQKPRVQVDAHAANAPQAGQRPSSRVDNMFGPVAENRPAASTVVPRPDSGPSTPILNPVPAPQQPVSTLSRPGTLPAQQGQEHENVVQIHIGRIEVRAVTPPAAPRISQAAASQPRLSLDDYLRQREEKK